LRGDVGGQRRLLLSWAKAVKDSRGRNKATKSEGDDLGDSAGGLSNGNRTQNSRAACNSKGIEPRTPCAIAREPHQGFAQLPDVARRKRLQRLFDFFLFRPHKFARKRHEPDIHFVRWRWCEPPARKGAAKRASSTASEALQLRIRVDASEEEDTWPLGAAHWRKSATTVLKRPPFGFRYGRQVCQHGGRRRRRSC
jgi:hypothetical protein